MKYLALQPKDRLKIFTENILYTSSTTGIAANLIGRRYLGIDQEEQYIEISKNNGKRRFGCNLWGFALLIKKTPHFIEGDTRKKKIVTADEVSPFTFHRLIIST